jgi:hypothetical protein
MSSNTHIHRLIEMSKFVVNQVIRGSKGSYRLLKCLTSPVCQAKIEGTADLYAPLQIFKNSPLTRSEPRLKCHRNTLTYSTMKETHTHGNLSRHVLTSVRFMNILVTNRADISFSNGWTEHCGMPKMSLLNTKSVPLRLSPHPVSKVTSFSKDGQRKQLVPCRSVPLTHGPLW